MNQADLDEFTQWLTELCVLYKMPVSERLIDLYWEVLACFPFAEVKAAFKAHLSNPDTGQFMPKPADVIRYLQGGSQTQALQAWSKVATTIRSVGGYTSVVFDDPIIHVVMVEMGGWIYLCQTLLKDLPFRAHEFKQRYAAYVLHPPLHYPKHLIGSIEGQNRMNGYHSAIKPPLFIGDPEQALKVFNLQHKDKPLLNVQPSSCTITNLHTDFILENADDTKILLRKNTNPDE